MKSKLWNIPWIPVFATGQPQPPAGGGGGGAWTLLSNTPIPAAATVDIISMVGHTHYCAMLRGLRSSQAFGEQLNCRISDDNGTTFKVTADHQGRKNSKHTAATTETDRAYQADTSWELIALGVNEGPDGLAQSGIFGWIWFWEPGIAATRESNMDYSFTYKNENGAVAQTKGHGHYPSFTNGLGAIDAFQLFMLNNFLASGSIDLYGIT